MILLNIPISNLKFVSKLAEKAVCVQLTDYITSNGLSETFQSAYKSFHSTETTLLRVQNDILCALDRNESYWYFWICRRRLIRWTILF